MVLLEQSSIINNGGHRILFQVITIKAKIRGDFNWLWCCYGNLLYNKTDHNLFTDDQAFFWRHYILAVSTDKEW